MLSLSRKQMIVLLVFLVSFLVTLVASMAILRVANPDGWHNFMRVLPDVVSNYN